MTEFQNRQEVLARSQVNSEPTFVDVAIGFICALILIGIVASITAVF